MKPLLVLSLLLALGGSARAQWEPINIGGGGWFERVGVGPTGLVVAASDLSGAYLSPDHGASWQALGADRGILATHCASVGFSAQDPGLFVLGTDAGITRTDDGGTTFVPALDDGYVESVTFAPGNDAVAYAAWHSAWNAADLRVYRSADRGATWNSVAGTIPAGRRGLEVVVSPADANVVLVLAGDGRFAGGPAELWRSINGGVSWQSVGGVFADRVVDVAFDPLNAARLWASVDDSDPDLPGHLYRSDDLGATWIHVAPRGGAIWKDAEAPGTIRMVDLRYQYPWDDRSGVWESTDGGAQWQQVSLVDDWQPGWQTIAWTFTAPLHSAAVDPSDPARFYWVNSQFVYVTDDRGRSVRQTCTEEVTSGHWRSRGLDNVVILDLAAAPGSTLWAGFFDLGLWRSQDAGASWTPCNQPQYTGDWQGAGGNTWTVLADAARPGVAWAPQSGDQYGASTLLRTMDAGAGCDQWTVVGAGLPAAPILGLSLDPTSPVAARRVYCCAAGDVWTSSDDGATFTPLTSIGGLHTTAVASDGTAYAGGEAGLFRSPIGGGPGPWLEVGLPAMRGPDPGPPFTGWQGVSGIAPDPAQPGRLYVAAHGAGKGIYRSDDHGGSWQKLLDDDFARQVAVDPATPSLLYATSSSAWDAGGLEPGSHGVWQSIDAGAHWSLVNDGLPWPFANPLAIDPQGSGRVYLGSPGTGIYRTWDSGVGVVDRPAPDLELRVAVADHAANIRFALPRPASTRLEIFDLRGRLVTRLLERSLAGGHHEVTWTGRAASSGVYLVKLTSGSVQAAGRFVWVR